MTTLNIKGFPEELYALLGKRAKEDRRSITGEVIFLLEWALEAMPKEKGSIMRLRGLGKKRWKNVRATNHVDSERQAWE